MIWSAPPRNLWTLPLPCATPTEDDERDQASPGYAARAGRLALRVCTGRRQARPPDQLLLPQPRRGHLRRIPAADGRNRLEELSEDLPRRDRRGENQVPLPGLAARPGGGCVTSLPWLESSSASPVG